MWEWRHEYKWGLWRWELKIWGWVLYFLLSWIRFRLQYLCVAFSLLFQMRNPKLSILLRLQHDFKSRNLFPMFSYFHSFKQYLLTLWKRSSQRSRILRRRKHQKQRRLFLRMQSRVLIRLHLQYLPKPLSLWQVWKRHHRSQWRLRWR